MTLFRSLFFLSKLFLSDEHISSKWIYISIFVTCMNDWLFWECNCGIINNSIMNTTIHLNWSNGTVCSLCIYCTAQQITTKFMKWDLFIYCLLPMAANEYPRRTLYAVHTKVLKTIMWQLIDVMSSLHLITCSINDLVSSHKKSGNFVFVYGHRFAVAHMIHNVTKCIRFREKHIARRKRLLILHKLTIRTF